jgi:hypothetical protein
MAGAEPELRSGGVISGLRPLWVVNIAHLWVESSQPIYCRRYVPFRTKCVRAYWGK